MREVSDKTTGAMQEFGDREAAGAQGDAGLVLLFAEDFQKLPPAWPLGGTQAVIGSDPSAQVQIPVNAVSRRHAEIVWEGGRWIIRDLNSRNGLLIDGARVSQVDLEPTHEIRAGDAIFKFVDRDADALSGYRIDGVMVGGKRRRAQSGTELVGGFQIDHIASDMERIAQTPLSVMVLGESGTGKEVVARELHRLSERRGQFHAINCAAIPGNLLESELFGYKRGAFSGADRDKPGIIRLADTGTLLLDEIGDMPLEAQAKLLRVLQSKEVYPLGATAPERVDVRVVCATHRDLKVLQEQGKFRKDLFARLNEYQLALPPLRERKEDVYVLVRALLARHGRPELAPTLPFMVGLLQHDWPYNVRELESCIKRCIALCQTPTLSAELLPDPVKEAMEHYGRPPRPGTTLAGDAGLAEAPLGQAGPPTSDVLRALLAAHQGNIAAVGRELGKARMQIHRWMKRYGIDADDYR